MLVAVIIIFLCALVAVFFGVKMSKHDKQNAKEHEEQFDAKHEGIYIVNQYMPHNFAYFLEVLDDIIPNTCVAFPYVRAGNILKCTSSKEELQNLMKEIVDICIFEKETMTPLLVIDLVDFGLQSNTLRDQKKELVKIFRAVGMPFVKFMVLESYDKLTLKNTIYLALPPEIRNRLGFEGHIIEKDYGFVETKKEEPKQEQPKETK